MVTRNQNKMEAALGRSFLSTDTSIRQRFPRCCMIACLKVCQINYGTGACRLVHPQNDFHRVEIVFTA